MMDLCAHMYFWFYTYLYFGVALIPSIFWGCYAIWNEANKYTEFETVTVRVMGSTSKTSTKWTIIEKISLCASYNKLGVIGSAGAFLSDFLLSMIGWGSLYLFLINYTDDKFSNLNIFLGLIAIICISGYGFKISEKITQFSR